MCRYPVLYECGATQELYFGKAEHAAFGKSLLYVKCTGEGCRSRAYFLGRTRAACGVCAKCTAGTGAGVAPGKEHGGDGGSETRPGYRAATDEDQRLRAAEDTEPRMARRNERSTLEDMAEAYYEKMQREGVDQAAEEDNGEQGRTKAVAPEA
jgi:hypothetical protein